MQDFWVCHLIISSTLTWYFFPVSQVKGIFIFFYFPPHSNQMRGITPPSSCPHHRCRQSQWIESLAFTNLTRRNEHYQRCNWSIATSYDLLLPHRQQRHLAPLPLDDNNDYNNDDKDDDDNDYDEEDEDNEDEDNSDEDNDSEDDKDDDDDNDDYYYYYIILDNDDDDNDDDTSTLTTPTTRTTTTTATLRTVFSTTIWMLIVNTIMAI